MSYYTEDLEILMRYFPTYPKRYVKMLYEDYSEDVWCAGWMMLPTDKEELDDRIREFRRWVTELELQDV